MKLATGKYYMTRDGRRVGPMRKWHPTKEWSWTGDGAKSSYNVDGESFDPTDWEDNELVVEVQP